MTHVILQVSYFYPPRASTTFHLRAKSFQSCPTLCHPMDCGPPGSSGHGDSPRQEYWSGLPCPPPGGLPDPGIEPVSLTSLAWQVGSLALVPPGKPITSTYLFLSWGNLGCLCFTAAASVARDTRGVPPVDLGGRCSEVYTGGWLGYRHMLS